MIAQELEICLHNAFVEARKKRHEFITAEHLLLALLGDDSVAAGVLGSLDVNLEGLRGDLGRLIEKLASISDETSEPDTQPTMQFQRAIQQAILSVQSSGRDAVTSADVLLALLNDSSLAALLEKRGVTRSLVLAEIRSASKDVAHQKKKPVPLADRLSPPPPDAKDLQVVLLNDDKKARRCAAFTLEMRR